MAPEKATRRVAEEIVEEDCKTNKRCRTSCFHQKDDSVLAPWHYILRLPGKDVRSLLIQGFQTWFKCEPDKVTSIKSIVGQLHNASLLIDDIQDNSRVRRGEPCAHIIFGVAPTINAANYVYFLGLEECQKLGSAAATNVFVQEVLNLHRGQGQDITWRDAGDCPTEAQYDAMVEDKTGGLFRLAVGLMQSLATEHVTTDFSPLVNAMALYFQIRDDLVNLADEDYSKTKGFCEDFTEGKFSLPIIHALRIADCGPALPAEIRSVLKQRTEDMSLLKFAQQSLRKAGSLAYAKQRCIAINEEIRGHLKDLGGNFALESIMTRLQATVEALQVDPK
jgi:geranylgeranyl diphosphate synthase type 3